MSRRHLPVSMTLNGRLLMAAAFQGPADVPHLLFR
jgi:hypothetical protein